MVKLKIKNFGPIKEGYSEDDGYLVISDVTLFVGDQGTGKSSIAKILSTCSWIEKALLKDANIYSLEFDETDKFTNAELTGESYDLKYRLEYQNIHSYFKDDTYIQYIGDYYVITYAEKETTFQSLHIKQNNPEFILPQIMYIPAERNFISVVEGAKNVKNLPSPLYTFLDEYEDSISALAGHKQKLPLDNFEYQYDNTIKEGVISNTENDYRIKLSEASSGLQSATPLFLVTDYLSKLVTGGYETLSKKRLSLDDNKSKDEMIQLVVEAGDYIEKEAELTNIHNRFRNRKFLNIVEEMEQNLYPKSQQAILYDLIRCVNSNSGNRLVLTTHSPYVINYLSLAIKAYTIKNKIKDADDNTLSVALNAIVPQESIISGDRVVIYELERNGKINKLPTWGEGIPSDENFLNESLRDTNDLFNDLLELEEKA